MSIPDRDRQLVRRLAARVAEIAADPANDRRRDLWIRLNRLERVRPLVHVQAIAWNIWEELIPPGTLAATDPFAREQELDLRRRIYCWEHFQDDRVVDGCVVCSVVLRHDLIAEGFGITRDIQHSGERSGAYAIRAVIAEEGDIDR
ncbi:MAG: hypothetical protein ABIL09_20095, partial [Gemmatimonadota bacterium]